MGNYEVSLLLREPGGTWRKVSLGKHDTWEDMERAFDYHVRARRSIPETYGPYDIIAHNGAHTYLHDQCLGTWVRDSAGYVCTS